MVRQLLARGILMAQGEYGTLAPGEQAAAVLRGEMQVPLRKDTIGRATTRERAVQDSSVACGGRRTTSRLVSEDRGAEVCILGGSRSGRRLRRVR